jgi:hypothetical protein
VEVLPDEVTREAAVCENASTVRLNLELESLTTAEIAPFQEKLDNMQKRIETELLPGLEKDLQELEENVPKFRQLEKRRAEKHILADRMLQECIVKKRTKT